jgi:hypothetical protein
METTMRKKDLKPTPYWEEQKKFMKLHAELPPTPLILPAGFGKKAELNKVGKPLFLDDLFAKVDPMDRAYAEMAVLLIKVLAREADAGIEIPEEWWPTPEAQ